MFKRFKWKKKNKPAHTLVESSEAEAALQQRETIELRPDRQNNDLVNERNVYLFPVSFKEVGGRRWGYINGKGKIVLKPIYEDASDFQANGLAIVRYNGLSGLIDTTGYFIVKPTYQTINPFSEGRATVIDHQGFKVIDENGKELTTKAYSFIGDYKEGRALFSIADQKGRSLYGFLNRWGKEVLPAVYESATDFKEGKSIVKLKDGTYALVNLTGKVLSTYSFPHVKEFGEDLLVFQNSIGKFGYINEQGKTIIKPQYSSAQFFQNGCAIVGVSDGKNEYFGLIDKKGQFILKPNYHQIFNLGEGRMAIGKAVNPEKPYIGALYALGDNSGHILTGFIFNDISKFYDGVASAANDHFTFFIDKKGKRFSGLPIISGSGNLKLDKTLIKGEIDFRLSYYKKNGDLVWQQNHVIALQEPYAVIEQKYKPNKDFLVYYPQITGMVSLKNQEKNNQLFKDVAGIKETPAYLQLESNYMGDFEVTFFKKELLVTEITGYNYPFGAAHGMPVKKYVHLNLRSGEVFQLKDLFKPGSPYVKILSELIGEQIKNNPTYEYVFPGSYKGIEIDQPFFITEEGLNIYFVPYEIAPYAAGFPVFTIPYEKLFNIINFKGDFWMSFHEKEA